MLNVELHSILKETFGHKSFRHNQLNIIKSILSGHDTLAIMPTGGGKSLCYQIPALHLDGVTLVISPLISLMKDQVDALKQNGIRAEFLNSTQDAGEYKQVVDQMHKGELDFLYMAPETLFSEVVYHQMQDLSFGLIAIDEAHCIKIW